MAGVATGCQGKEMASGDKNEPRVVSSRDNQDGVEDNERVERWMKRNWIFLFLFTITRG